MRRFYVVPVLVTALFLSGCCFTKVVLSGNGNAATGEVGGSIEVRVCTPMEQEVANQLKILSDWYHQQWADCEKAANQNKCRQEILKAYQEQEKTLIDVLSAMKGKSEEEQKKLYGMMLSTMKIKFQ